MKSAENVVSGVLDRFGSFWVVSWHLPIQAVWNYVRSFLDLESGMSFLDLESGFCVVRSVSRDLLSGEQSGRSGENSPSGFT